MTPSLPHTTARPLANMAERNIRNIVIVGGGTAGWMSAAALSNVLVNGCCRIRLVESDQIGTVGVGEATIPQINTFNRLLGIDEDDFVRSTRGTFKLGIEFVNWRRIGDRYMHPFGVFGAPMNAIPFHHYWLKMHRDGKVPNLDAYSLACVAAPSGKFSRPIDIPKSPLAQISYAFQFDARLYAAYLRSYAERNGVSRTEGKVTDVHCRDGDGFIESIALDSGEVIDGDLFIDCTGFRGLLIGRTLGVDYEDWSRYLPCDRAIAVPSASVGDPLPYTRATAHRAGWQWRIPLQHRIGNGHVYSSAYIDDDEALTTLLENLESEPLAEPLKLRFTPGRRRRFWEKNCVAIGLSSGFLEPLESTSIHLIQTGIAKLIGLFPDRSFDQADIDKYNQQSVAEIESIRDFLILHYKATERRDSRFWDYCRTMTIPESLENRIRLYEANGRLYREGDELFSVTSWLAVLHGQGVEPRGYHPIVDAYSDDVVAEYLQGVAAVIRRSAAQMPTHADFIAKHCAAATG